MAERPNVLLINCDDMGYGDLGCYGSQVNETPTIDALAAEGVKFTSFYAASPVCSPSRASLMTGCYPVRVGITRVLMPGEPYGLNPAEYTMPRLFSDAGYATKCVGKWHCGDQPESLPLRFGFDEYYGLPYSNDMGMKVGKTDFDRFPPLPLMSGDDVIEEQPDQTTLTERYVEQCVQFIRKNRDRPFFLYFAQMHVHLPLYAPNHFVKTSRNGDFGACMADVDWSVKVLLYELKKLGLYENTLIIFTSDNGSRNKDGASNAPLRGRKHTVWEGGLRVPFIVHWKGHVKEGTVVDHMASNIDLLPTFAAMLGRKLPETKIDGLDITPMLYGEDRLIRNEFCYYCSMDLGAIRVGKWKLHRYNWNLPGIETDKNSGLYDLEQDIGETTDVSAEHPDIVEKLEARAMEMAELLGEYARNIKGKEVRPCLCVENPKKLTCYDENHPYIVALYDKPQMG